jgi:hypothetical protein
VRSRPACPTVPRPNLPPGHAPENIGDDTVAHGGDGFGNIVGFQQFVALLVDHLALVVGNVVVFKQLLADIEVAGFDLALRRFQRASDERMLDGLAFRHLQLVHDGAQALAGKNAQQRIVQRQIEARGAGVALTTGATAQLVVDTARFVAFGADDMQTASGQHLIVHRFCHSSRICAIFASRSASGSDSSCLMAERIFSILPPSTMSVPRPAMLVAMVTMPRLAGLHDNFRLTGMLLGVEHLMRHFFLVEQAGKQFGGFDRSRTDQHRLTALGAILDIGNDCRMLSPWRS